MFLPIMPNFVIDNAKHKIDIMQANRNGQPFTEAFLHDSYAKHLFDDMGKPKYTLPADDPNPSPAPYRSSASGLTPAQVKEVDFINADLAKYYGMSKATAYQEALSNTAYQRSVQDMKAAGLNPSVLFGSGRATPASASIYASEERSGGGSGRRYGTRSSGNGKLFSSGMYYGISTAVGLATAVMTKNPANYWIGSAGAQGVMGALNAVMK